MGITTSVHQFRLQREPNPFKAIGVTPLPRNVRYGKDIPTERGHHWGAETKQKLNTNVPQNETMHVKEWDIV